ncbi:MAG TPA: enoyl-CoA hydratase/isomerase family protein [Solirubrobacterales bacterium]|nr:enoyl-CoA hydratase/isomerase family protein [Solirubrobacterales bacterium]
MTDKTLDVTYKDDVALITLDRPEALNALNLRLKDELGDVLTAEIASDSTKAIVITGAGRGFCAGADLKDMAPEQGLAYRKRLEALQDRVIAAIAAAPKAVICAVNGPCVGAGVGMVAASDITIAAPEAYFLAPFVQSVGVAPDFGLAHTLPRVIGAARAKAMFLLGERVGAETARDWGLVHEVVPGDELVARAIELAKRVSGGAAGGVAGTKRLMAVAEAGSLGELLAAEASEQALLRLGDDHEDAISSFKSRGGAPVAQKA